ncbi:hypothetical protein C0995_005720, partial [Termitomyces sp. Mi166
MPLRQGNTFIAGGDPLPQQAEHMMDLAQQHNKILWDLYLSRAELFQQAQDLFKNLEQPKPKASAK